MTYLDIVVAILLFVYLLVDLAPDRPLGSLRFPRYDISNMVTKRWKWALWMRGTQKTADRRALAIRPERDQYTGACREDAAGHLRSPHLMCSYCRTTHPARLFSPAERRAPAQMSRCIGSTAKLRIWSHVSLTHGELSELLDLGGCRHDCQDYSYLTDPEPLYPVQTHMVAEGGKMVISRYHFLAQVAAPEGDGDAGALRGVPMVLLRESAAAAAAAASDGDGWICRHIHASELRLDLHRNDRYGRQIFIRGKAQNGFWANCGRCRTEMTLLRHTKLNATWLLTERKIGRVPRADSLEWLKEVVGDVSDL